MCIRDRYTEDEVVEMDTVKGVREQGKRLLTMIFRTVSYTHLDVYKRQVLFMNSPPD